MDQVQDEVLKKNVIDDRTFVENGQEKVRREFLEYCALDALLEEHPDRLFFSRAERNQAKARFENDPVFMELQKNLTKLYALRQIIAGTKDPDAVSQTLDEDLSLRVESLNADPAFRNALRGMEINDQYTGRVVNTITKTGSFEQMNRQLQRDGEKLFRHEIKAHNKALELNPAGKDELNQERVPSPGV